MVLQMLLWLTMKVHILKVRIVLLMTFNNTNKTGKNTNVLCKDMKKSVVEMITQDSIQASGDLMLIPKLKLFM
jgi:hypothetical protein